MGSQNPFMIGIDASAGIDNPVDVPSGGGFFGGVGDLFKNKLFLQYLNEAGKALAAPKAPGQTTAGNVINAVSGVTAQSGQNKNLVDIFSKMLGGQAPGTTAKIDDKGVTINLARETPVGQPGPNPGQTGVPSLTTSQSQLGGLQNPFVSGLPNFSASELAGLTPEMITQALGFRLNQQQAANEAAFKAQQLASENIFRQAQINEINSRIEQDREQAKIARMKAEAIDPLDKPFPIKVPELGEVTTRQWNALPKEEQMYSIYRANAKEGKVLSREEYKNLDPTEKEKFLRSAMKDPKLMKAAKELAQAESTQINLSPFEETKQREGAQAVANVLSWDYPDKVMKDYDPVSNMNRIKEYQKKGMSFTDAQNKAAYVTKLKRMHEGIVQAYRSIGKEVTTDNKTGWFVDGKLVRAFPK